MANHEEEEEERKSGRRGGPEEEKEGLRSEKHKRHEEEQKSMMKDWDSTKIVYLCFGLYGQDHPVVYCSIEPLEFSSYGVWSMGQYPVGPAHNGIGIGAYGSKIVFAGGQESSFEGYKYRSCPSKGMRIIDTEYPDRIIDPSYARANQEFLMGGLVKSY
ncbi:hypothetical protein ACE6H2_018983 [Prunus campanulata]